MKNVKRGRKASKVQGLMAIALGNRLIKICEAFPESKEKYQAVAIGRWLNGSDRKRKIVEPVPAKKPVKPKKPRSMTPSTVKALAAVTRLIEVEKMDAFRACKLVEFPDYRRMLKYLNDAGVTAHIERNDARLAEYRACSVLQGVPAPTAINGG